MASEKILSRKKLLDYFGVKQKINEKNALDDELKWSSIDADAFNGLNNLTELNLANNKIASIDANTFNGLNNLTELNLANNKIASIDANTFNGLKNLEWLHLDNNQIASIEANTFNGLNNLTGLYLDNNQIASIDVNTFNGLNNLEILYLYNNKIASIDANTFNGLNNLTELNLANNKIASIDVNTFNGLKNLEWLHLDNNRIASIEANTFNGLTKLTDLYLDNNQIASIEPNTFNGLNNLKRLYLQNNQIASIDVNTFNGLKNLEWLHLDNNQIASIDANMFNGLTKLTDLYLDNNQIASIEPNTFNGLNNLTRLYLQNNQIASIDVNTFNGLKNLEWLHLANNQIASIDANMFKGLNNLTRLYLYNNQIASIDADTFNGLNNLTELNLANNQIRSIDVNTFNGLNELTDLRLDGNLFNEIDNVSNKTFKGIKFLMLFNEWLFYPNAHTIESNDTFTLTKENYKEKLCTRKIENILTLSNQSLSHLELSNSKYKSLLSNFKWSSIRPDVSVLIGENGCGKTTLLTLIDECLRKDSFELKHYTHKYFTSMERVVNNLNENKSFESFNKELLLQINSSYSSLRYFNLRDCLYDSINYFSSILYFDYLLSLYEFKVDEFNKFLSENDFKYQFNDDKCEQRRKTQQEIEKLLRDENKRNEINYYKDLNPIIESYFDNQTEIRLSPGEDLFLLILLWSFHAKILKIDPYLSLPVKSKRRIVLLDEPDAHMHPRLIKKFIDLILLSDDFDLLNIQLIMTTHNPLTLSFVPIENVFIVSNESVLPAKLKGYAQTVQLLTHNLISLNKPFRLVFVEANDDKVFYEMILKKFEMLKFDFVLKVPISFQCLPGINPTKDSQVLNEMTNKKPSVVKDLLDLIHGNSEINIEEEINKILDLIIQKVSQVNNETKEKVKEIVKKFRPLKEADNNTGVTNLPNDTFFGIVDGDDEQNNKNEPHIIYTEQYSLENYVLTPLTIFLLAKRFLKNHFLVKAILDETKLNGVNINSIGDILQQENGIELIQMIFDKITQIISKRIDRKLEQYPNILNNRYVVNRKHDENEKAFEFELYYTDKKRSKRLKQTQLLTINTSGGSYTKLSLSTKLPKEKVEYIHSKTELFKIDVALFLLKMKGKWLQEFYEEIFPGLKKELLQLQELKGRKETDSLCRLTLDYQTKVLKDKGDIILLPKELKQHFQLIHELNVKDNDEEGFLVTYLKEIKKIKVK
jgi:Leucine-rich repeat (LRR) protein